MNPLQAQPVLAKVARDFRHALFLPAQSFARRAPNRFRQNAAAVHAEAFAVAGVFRKSQPRRTLPRKQRSLRPKESFQLFAPSAHQFRGKAEESLAHVQHCGIEPLVLPGNRQALEAKRHLELVQRFRDPIRQRGRAFFAQVPVKTRQPRFVGRIAFRFAERKIKSRLHSARFVRKIDADVAAGPRRNSRPVESQEFSRPQRTRFAGFLRDHLARSLHSRDLPSGVPARLPGIRRGKFRGQIPRGQRSSRRGWQAFRRKRFAIATGVQAIAQCRHRWTCLCCLHPGSCWLRGSSVKLLPRERKTGRRGNRHGVYDRFQPFSRSFAVHGAPLKNPAIPEWLPAGGSAHSHLLAASTKCSWRLAVRSTCIRTRSESCALPRCARNARASRPDFVSESPSARRKSSRSAASPAASFPRETARAPRDHRWSFRPARASRKSRTKDTPEKRRPRPSRDRRNRKAPSRSASVPCCRCRPWARASSCPISRRRESSTARAIARAPSRAQREIPDSAG